MDGHVKAVAGLTLPPKYMVSVQVLHLPATQFPLL